MYAHSHRYARTPWGRDHPGRESLLAFEDCGAALVDVEKL
jgi:hypothetical protein